MDNDKDAELFVEEVLHRFAFHRYVNGPSIHAALDAVRNEAGDIVELMIAGVAIVGQNLRSSCRR
jgi:hypothetical protein